MYDDDQSGTLPARLRQVESQAYPKDFFNGGAFLFPKLSAAVSVFFFAQMNAYIMRQSRRFNNKKRIAVNVIRTIFLKSV